ncbi:MAG: D-2-hydroxyacid dehydrogenase [Ruminococcus sp.]|nr:D-2-hydroxyacid dehydrogenase [Ruminococcus sp.]
MKLVILDSETVSCNGDVSLEGITSLGNTTVYGYVPNDLVAEKIGDADAVICNKCLITREVFQSCPNLKYVGLFATGYNNVDVKAAKDHGAVVCNVPAYSTDSVAQHTFALILDHACRIRQYADSVDRGDWVNYKLFSYFSIPTLELSGMTLGIIGFGNIGRKVAQIAGAFSMKVKVYTRSPEKCGGDVECVSLEELLSASDIITVHCPLNEGTKELINKDTIAMMKPTAFFVNTARGGIMNEQDLADALNAGRIAGAGIDCLTFEPMREDCPLRGAKNCTITPHVAWAPKQTRERLVGVVAQNLKGWLNGEPENNVAL